MYCFYFSQTIETIKGNNDLMQYLILLSGRHTLSGACIEPIALDELFPDWKERGVYYTYLAFFV
jgi:hypothetical protein